MGDLRGTIKMRMEGATNERGIGWLARGDLLLERILAVKIRFNQE